MENANLWMGWVVKWIERRKNDGYIYHNVSVDTLTQLSLTQDSGDGFLLKQEGEVSGCNFHTHEDILVNYCLQARPQ